MFEESNQEVARQQVREETSIQYQLTLNDIIEQIRQYLKGYKYDPRNDEYEQIFDEPLLNKRGIQLVMKYLQPLVNRNTILADLKRAEAEDYAKRVHKNIARDLFAHSNDIGLDDIGSIRSISSMVGNAVFFALTRAVRGKTAEQVNRSLTIRENKMDSNSRKLLRGGG